MAIPKEQTNNDLAILYKVLSKIKPYTILSISAVPEYVDAILNSKQPYTDIGIYNMIKSTYIKMLTRGAGNGASLRALTRVSKDVFGDADIWKKDISTDGLFFMNGLEKINEILAIRIGNIPDFVSALRNHNSTIYTDEDIYKILKSVCVMKKMNDNLSVDELKVMNGISRVITGSPVTWKKERNIYG